MVIEPVDISVGPETLAMPGTGIITESAGIAIS
jgi:hypothetical protein